MARPFTLSSKLYIHFLGGVGGMKTHFIRVGVTDPKVELQSWVSLSWSTGNNTKAAGRNTYLLYAWLFSTSWGGVFVYVLSLSASWSLTGCSLAAGDMGGRISIKYIMQLWEETLNKTINKWQTWLHVWLSSSLTLKGENHCMKSTKVTKMSV